MREFVGPYRVIDALGRGGMGIVYRGVHNNLNRKVAIKALAPELTQDPEFRRRFFSEARTQAQLQHPNIVTIYDLLEDQGDFFIVMEFVAGHGLDEILLSPTGQGMATEEALRIFAQILAALECAHQAGVIHRDVKPSNVLVTEQGVVKLMDFGIALLVGDVRLTQSAQTIGTPVYMSPEQILRPRQVDHRTDIYSAGVLLYEMLSGRPPFDAETEFEIKKLHIEAPSPDIRTLAPTVTPAISQALARSLAKEPGERFQSAAAFSSALGYHAGGVTGPSIEVVPPPPSIPYRSTERSIEPSGTPTVAPPLDSQRVSRFGPWVIGSGIAFVLLVVVVALMWNSVRKPETEEVAVTPSLQERATRQRPLPSHVGESPAPLLPSPEDTAPPLPPPPEVQKEEAPPPPPPPPKRDIQAEVRKRTIAQLRRNVQTGIVEVKALIAGNQLELARGKVRDLIQRSAQYPSEFEDEMVELHVMDGEITSGVVSQKIAVERQAAKRFRWEEKLRDIRNLLDSERFPEAKQLAKGVSEDAAVPEDIREHALGLIAEAEAGLQSIFSDTEWEASESTIQKKPKKKKINQ